MKYDAWLQVSLTEQCNLKCRYCLAEDLINNPSRTGPLVDAEAFSRTLRESGHTFYVVFTGGGEPFVMPNIADLCAEVATEHFIGLNTNLTYGKRIAEFARKVPPDRVLRIHASLHLQELQRLDVLEEWISRYKSLRDAGFPIAAIPVAHPSISEVEVENLSSSLTDSNDRLSWAPFIGEWEHRTFPDEYTRKELARFRFKGAYSHSEVHRPQGWLCPAGVRVAHVDTRGDVWVCHSIPEQLGSIKTGFTFKDSPVKCSLKCACPYFAYEPDLLVQSIRANQNGISEDSVLYLNGQVVRADTLTQQ